MNQMLNRIRKIERYRMLDKALEYAWIYTLVLMSLNIIGGLLLCQKNMF